MNEPTLDTLHKAQSINHDHAQYGVFAEIGAGQEVVRWFFQAGGAAGTVAKSMSAYDMAVSDAIYGSAKRYVSEDRLTHMLEHEFGLLHERLQAERGAKTRFFAYANTVAARSYSRQVDGMGWMGIRFQTRPQGPPNDIVMHVRLLDATNVLQQEAVGIVGVNLIYAAAHHFADPAALVKSLLDGVGPERVEVDMLRINGPDFVQVDNRLVSLQLVEEGLAQAAMFDDHGNVEHAADALFHRPILVERGSFRPVTNTTLHMLQSALGEFSAEPKVIELGNKGAPVQVLFEMTLKNLIDNGRIDHRDFLERVDMLGAAERELGHGAKIVVSNFGEFHRLAGWIFRNTKAPVGLVLGVPTLRELFNEQFYTTLEGGILEAFGRLFRNDLRLYVYPQRGADGASVVTARDFRPEGVLAHFYEYLLHTGCLRDLKDFNPAYLDIFAREALAKIRAGDAAWENMVPAPVAQLIRQRRLLGAPA